MRFIVKENIIRGMYDNGNLMIYAAADGVKDNKNSCVCSECVSEKGEKKYDYLMPVNLRIILMYVNNECDKYEYDGSPMFDCYPDRIIIGRMVQKICGERCNDPYYNALVQVMLCKEMRCRRNRRDCHKKRILH